jgi:hypothetical protein
VLPHFGENGENMLTLERPDNGILFYLFTAWCVCVDMEMFVQKQPGPDETKISKKNFIRRNFFLENPPGREFRRM